MRLAGKKIISLVHHDFEDLELWYPILRLKEEGAIVHLAGEKANETYIGKYGVPAISDYEYGSINAREYDAILVPGGWAPDKIRRFPEVLSLLQSMEENKKPIGQICHAGWVLISAKILQGKNVTSTPGIKDDMENAGATWIDEPVVVDGNLVSSRRPPDLPDYLRELINVIEKG
ncbi:MULTISPECIES: type 1 glutamine amidotransferase domain-containing protein [Peribacillus]|jgi:protease I|uniref:type 1 glutamine amidotransferase domain-containing protein n=1 Tax=Peribacillus TaxID=2675229 RepID=UPI0006BED858|nr:MULTISPECIES: type 1 glutamine amidotransferase domain-containing protein [Peribacillus]KOR83963.1 glutamine amidotransferase [Bacillus sp. FJAT-22058]MEC0343486.1 type 1 glutamine amidotransferase [Peribacillus castrilensis]PRS35463.1 type 1 glutamine amidotransferase [Bacillus sp. RJGP41]TDL89932.1 type 1 glutamine amidotransferase [Vibrio vulnificus]AZV60822.1 type 1 glutamine amidotransferase [Peribacillus frigoritolerans]